MSSVPIAAFPPSLHAGGGSRVLPLDVAPALGLTGPASAPALLAAFVVLARGDGGAAQRALGATSHALFAVRGSGETRCSHGTYRWYVTPI